MNFKSPYLILFLLTLVFLVFNNENSQIDAWYYAACVKHQHDLFQTHHLFYNGFARLFYLCLKIVFPALEALRAMQIMNALAGFFSLLVLYKTLFRLSLNQDRALFFTLLCGVSFGFMRFATDAETYILPVLMSLLATYFLIREDFKGRFFFSAVFAVLAILFHQVHLWWSLALLLFVLLESKSGTADRWLSLSAYLLLPVAYLGVYYFFELNKQESFLAFLLGTYHKGQAGLDFSFQALGLTAINLIRTCFQIHGDIYPLAIGYPKLFLLICLSSLVLLVFALRKPHFKIKSGGRETRLGKYLFLGFCLQILFSFLSSGNAEFMVMLPFMAVLIIVISFDFTWSARFYLLIPSLLIWNLGIGLLPATYLPMQVFKNQVALCQQHPEAIYYWSHKPLVENQLHYKLGFAARFKLFSLKELNRKTLDSLLNKHQQVFTDAGLKEATYSRRALTGVRNYNSILDLYAKEKVDSYSTIYGKNYLYKLLPKE